MDSTASPYSSPAWLDDLGRLLARLAEHGAPVPYSVFTKSPGYDRVRVDVYTHTVEDFLAARRAVGACEKAAQHGHYMFVGRFGSLVEITDVSDAVLQRPAPPVSLLALETAS